MKQTLAPAHLELIFWGGNFIIIFFYVGCTGLHCGAQTLPGGAWSFSSFGV